MCGIVVSLEKKSQIDIPLLEAARMSAKIKHRGPDGDGIYILYRDNTEEVAYDVDSSAKKAEPNCEGSKSKFTRKPPKMFMAHRRLAILDLGNSARQPMVHHSDRYVMVYNGEVYNYLEIRAELEELGHKIESSGDSEVVLAAYTQWGSDCLQKFNGEWAFCIFDKKKNGIFISRDRFGIKPLYFFHDDESLIFCSEIKGILEHSRINSSPDLKQIKSYVQNGPSEWNANTLFEGVCRFPAAHYAFVPLDDISAFTPKKFWTPTINNSVESYSASKAEAYADEYYSLLKNAVKLRLRSDVPLGCSLSGGLDSASVTYLANEIRLEQGLQLPLTTFSLVHDDGLTSGNYDESKFIDLVTGLLETNSSKITPEIASLKQIIDETNYYFDQPPASFGVAGVQTVRLAKNLKLKVILDGQGADEILAGYLKYWTAHLATKRLGNFIIESFNLFRHSSSKVMALQLMAGAFALKVFGTNSFNHVARLLGKSYLSKKPDINSILWDDIQTSLTNLIHFSDSRSMWHSIEARMPFLDHRLVEFLLKIPAAYKLNNGYTKYIARLAFKNKLPDEIVWRKDKMGWPVPQKFWLDTTLKSWAEQSVKDSKLASSFLENGIYDTQLLKRKIRTLNLALWHGHFWK